MANVGDLQNGRRESSVGSIPGYESSIVHLNVIESIYISALQQS